MRITMISLPPADHKHMMGESGSRFNHVYVGTRFTECTLGGKLTQIDEAGYWNLRPSGWEAESGTAPTPSAIARTVNFHDTKLAWGQT